MTPLAKYMVRLTAALLLTAQLLPTAGGLAPEAIQPSGTSLPETVLLAPSFMGQALDVALDGQDESATHDRPCGDALLPARIMAAPARACAFLFAGAGPGLFAHAGHAPHAGRAPPRS